MKIVHWKPRYRNPYIFEGVDLTSDAGWEVSLIKRQSNSLWTCNKADHVPPVIGSKIFYESFKSIQEAKEWCFLQLL